MKSLIRIFIFLTLAVLTGCAAGRKSFNPDKKYPASQLKEDFAVMRQVLEKFHPSIYWYTSKDSMDQYFDYYAQAIKDSMTESDFGFHIVAPVLTAIRCGHTSFNYSKAYSKFLADKRLPSFPLGLKVWSDTMVVTFNLNRRDSVFKRGTLITGINLWNNQRVIDSLFNYMPADGYSQNVNYIRLSSAFGYYHRNIFGLSKNYAVQYIDSTGQEKLAALPLFTPSPDSLGLPPAGNRPPARPPRDTERSPSRLEARRSFRIDTAKQVGIMTINTFGSGAHLKSFYRKTFKWLRKNNIKNLVIDVRNNGGGDINHFAQLSSYIRNTPFKVADTAAAVINHFGPSRKYFQYHFFNSMAFFFLTTKREDGRYHFRYWENHDYQPKEKNHYNGNVYVLISGPSFSATTLFAQSVKGQSNVTLVGEEAGGGAHGNNGVMIPNITLPNTRLRVRVPLFRLVQYNHPPKDGHGVQPDVLVPPTVEGVRRGADLKMEKVMSWIQQGKSAASATP